MAAQETMQDNRTSVSKSLCDFDHLADKRYYDK